MTEDSKKSRDRKGAVLRPCSGQVKANFKTAPANKKKPCAETQGFNPPQVNNRLVAILACLNRFELFLVNLAIGRLWQLIDKHNVFWNHEAFHIS